MESELTRVEKLEFDLDTRLFDLWVQIQQVEEWSIETAAAAMRVAYAKGYYDALEEIDYDVLEGTKLGRDNGYRSSSHP